MIQVTSISKSYEKHQVLSSVSGSFPKGKITCIIGENGSGKSTLLSIMSGILIPDSGTVTYGENHRTPFYSSVSLLPQKDQLFSDLTVKNNLDFWGAANNISNPKEHLRNTARLLGLDPFLQKKISSLSGGMRRRVAIGVALLGNPQYLLLDEPFTGLDLLHKEELSRYLKTLSKNGTTIVYSAHNVDEIHTMADTLFAIKQGHIHPLSLPSSLDDLYMLVTNFIQGGTSREQ